MGYLQMWLPFIPLLDIWLYEAKVHTIYNSFYGLI